MMKAGIYSITKAGIYSVCGEHTAYIGNLECASTSDDQHGETLREGCLGSIQFLERELKKKGILYVVDINDDDWESEDGKPIDQFFSEWREWAVVSLPEEN